MSFNLPGKFVDSVQLSFSTLSHSERHITAGQPSTKARREPLMLELRREAVIMVYLCLCKHAAH